MAIKLGVQKVYSMWRDTLKWSLIILPPIIALNDNLASVQIVAGKSMSPTLNPNALLDIVFVSRISEFSRGDIVLMLDPVREDRTLIVKRVVDISRDGSSVFVLGDNPDRSTDSRQFGSVPSHLVHGVVKAVVFPPWRWGSDLKQRTKTDSV
jgi:nickel-type superoxide dismutase maturation protease